MSTTKVQQNFFRSILFEEFERKMLMGSKKKYIKIVVGTVHERVTTKCALKLSSVKVRILFN
jgi:hypothetical protein